MVILVALSFPTTTLLSPDVRSVKALYPMAVLFCAAASVPVPIASSPITTLPSAPTSEVVLKALLPKIVLFVLLSLFDREILELASKIIPP